MNADERRFLMKSFLSAFICVHLRQKIENILCNLDVGSTGIKKED